MAHNDDPVKIYEQSFIDNFTLPALTEYTTGKTQTYGEVARKMARIHLFYKEYGIRPGDKIALLGRNTPYWVTVFMATLTYGAVIVPILHDFNPMDAQHIINHSDSLMLFVQDHIWENLDYDKLPEVRCAISLDSRKVLGEHEAAGTGKRRGNRSAAALIKGLTRKFKSLYPDGFRPSSIKYESQPSDAVAVLNYTSGTTGFSKGVMLTYGNVAGNLVFGLNSHLHYRGSRVLSFLPLAHAYGCAFDMIVPLAAGTHITLLGKMPTPKLLIKAFGEVKPSLILCVPMILEKIYRRMILPMITRKPIRWALAVPMLDHAVYARIRSRLEDAFGGEFEQVIVGGAPLNSEVEQFLQRIKFRFTVGYGMTECGPLISYTRWQDFKPGSAGQALPGFMQAKILSDGGSDTPGEILVKGTNVMKGYYKNPDATEAVLDTDGWLHTGDMGTVDDDGTIYIRGRYKTMILSSNGQNIYPEEIEAKLANMPYVAECLVVERNGRLTALVYPDSDAADREGLGDAGLIEKMDENRVELNKLVAPYERIEAIQLVPYEFEKTPKKSIKRFLYT